MWLCDSNTGARTFRSTNCDLWKLLSRDGNLWALDYLFIWDFWRRYLTDCRPASPLTDKAGTLLSVLLFPTGSMLLTSPPARLLLVHLERVRSTPSYDHAPAPMPKQAASSHDLYRPANPSPLRLVTNAPEQPPSVLQHRLPIADLGTSGDRAVGFPYTHKRSLSTSKNAKFKGPDIIVPLLPSSPVPPTLPTEKHPDEARNPPDCSDIPDRPSLCPSSGTSDESTSIVSSDHTCLSSFFNHETPVADEFPDSPSMYSPTPPNSSAPSAIDLSESSTGWPNLADVNLAITDIGHHYATAEEFSGEKLSEEQPTGEQPCDKDGLAPTPKEASRGKSHRSEWWFVCVSGITGWRLITMDCR